MRDWQIRRRSPYGYDPSTDSGLAFWVDATDTTTLTASGGGAITNGATIGSWASKKGTARSWTQWGSQNRPTWDSAGINGLAAAKYVAASSQILGCVTGLGDFSAMSGLTVMAAVRRVSANGLIFTTTMLDISSGTLHFNQCQLNMGPTFTGGGRQARGDSFVTVVAVPAVNTPPIFVECIAFGFGTGHISLYGNGVENIVNQAYHTPGTTNAGDPFSLGIGGSAVDSGTAFGFADGWIGEILGWLTEKSPDDLVPPHDYMRRRWGAGAM